MKRTLLVQDGVLVRQAAMAAGQQALTELQRYHTEREEFYEASKVAYAGVLAVGYYAARDGAGSSSIDDALALLAELLLCENDLDLVLEIMIIALFVLLTVISFLLIFAPTILAALGSVFVLVSVFVTLLVRVRVRFGGSGVGHIGLGLDLGLG